MVEILDETCRYPFRKELKLALTQLKAELGASERELTLILCGDEQIRKFNLTYRQKDSTPDVLSFPLAEPEDAGVPVVSHLGDIMIGVDVAARQAPAHGHDLRQEVLTLAAHGLMHLLGHNHPSEDEWITFRTAQARILELSDRL
ncbi:MAG: rRNA maturation RNase YbeY [Truepera sp.]|nr:rRNA maturation RNase YbeY [Truepera sp.]